jgi:hypothetical protein
MAIIMPYLSALAQILIVAPLTLILSVVLAIASVISAYLSPTKLLEPKTILITGMEDCEDMERCRGGWRGGEVERWRDGEVERGGER